MIPCGYQADGTTSPLLRGEGVLCSNNARSRKPKTTCCTPIFMKKISSSKNSVDTKCFAGRQLLPGSEEQQYQKLTQHKAIMQQYIYSFSFIADRRAAFDPPVNLSADFADQKIVPTHSHESTHIHN